MSFEACQMSVIRRLGEILNRGQPPEAAQVRDNPGGHSHFADDEKGTYGTYYFICGVSGGNAVAERRVSLVYNAAGQFTGIDRYKALDFRSANLVAESSYGYDGIGRLTDLTHVHDTTTIADYDWTFDAAGRVTGMSFTSLAGSYGDSDYSYLCSCQRAWGRILTGKDGERTAGAPAAAGNTEKREGGGGFGGRELGPLVPPPKRRARSFHRRTAQSARPADRRRAAPTAATGPRPGRDPQGDPLRSLCRRLAAPRRSRPRRACPSARCPADRNTAARCRVARRALV